jgi:sugar diacid utilization regulator
MSVQQQHLESALQSLCREQPLSDDFATVFCRGSATKVTAVTDATDAGLDPLEGAPDEFDEALPGWQLTRLPRPAVRAAREARLPATLLGPFLDALVDAAASGRRLPSGQLDEYRRLGRVAAEQGAPLPALVDLYLSAMWRAWPELPAVSAHGAQEVTVESLRRAGQSVLRAADDAVAALCEGYSSAQQAVARAEAEQRRSLVDDLLTGTSDIGSLLPRAAAIGLHLEAPYVVLVVSGSRALAEGRPTERRVEAVLREQLGRRPARATIGGAGLLVATRHGLLVAVVPHGHDSLPGTGTTGSPEDDETDALVTRVEEALERENGLRWRVGVSRPRTGGAGVRAGYQEAARTVELAEALSWPSRVVHAQALLIYQVLARDSEAMRELISATLLPLRDARGGAEPLLATLRAYFAAGGVATAAARTLHLSVRALTYRLERIARLTGHDPTDPEDRFTLQAATVGQQLLGWP